MLVCRNSFIIMVCVGVLSPAVWAQKKVAKAVSAAAKKAEINVTDLYFPPYRMAGYLQRSAANRSRQALLSSWNLTAAQLERQSAKYVARPAQVSAVKQGKNHAPQTQLAKPGMSEVIYAQHNTQFLRDYLKSHRNQWPVYHENDSEQNHTLRRVMALMEAEETNDELLETKREIIRLRAASRAQSPYEIKQMLRGLLAGGVVPVRYYPGSGQKHVEEEIAMGEETAFAILASQVPMEDNPWKTAGMDGMADKVNTYNAMRRADPLFEGIPITYTNEYGMQDHNIPVLTSQMYAIEQKAFAQLHPFTYALATYWEKNFGTVFYRVFNHLDPVSKQAVLLNAPALPQQVDMRSEAFAAYCDQALERWIGEKGREPGLRIRESQRKQFEAFLQDPQAPAQSFLFRNQGRMLVDFLDLQTPEQLEVLLALWKQHKVLPQDFLNRLGKPQAYF